MSGARDEAARLWRLLEKKESLSGLLSIMQELEDSVGDEDTSRFLENMEKCEKAAERLKKLDCASREEGLQETQLSPREAALSMEIEALLKQAELLSAKTVRLVEENMKVCLSETKRLRRSSKGIYYLKSGFGFPMAEFDKIV